MNHLEVTPAGMEEILDERPLHKREVLWAFCIILGLTMAPAVGDIYFSYGM